MPSVELRLDRWSDRDDRHLGIAMETERMASTAVDVECHAGYSGEETPRRFHLGERQVEIAEVVCATRLPSIVC
jgi:hypothetical protein